ITAWGMQAFTARPRPDVLVIGTDPILSGLSAIPWRMAPPRAAIAHWGFDIYHEAPIADGMLSEHSLLVRAIRTALKRAYRTCDLIVDVGSCMRNLLAVYGSRAKV